MAWRPPSTAVTKLMLELVDERQVAHGKRFVLGIHEKPAPIGRSNRIADLICIHGDFRN
jgi:hypothetical protein